MIAETHAKPTLEKPHFSDAQIKQIAFYALTRIDHARTVGGCPADGFPTYDRTHTYIGNRQCEIIVGVNDAQAVFVNAYPPVATGLRPCVDVTSTLAALIQSPTGTEPKTRQSQPSGLLSAAGPKTYPPLPDPRDIDKTLFEAFEKLVRSGSCVPRQLWDGLVGHVEHGHHTGAALNYILIGDLYRAALFSDDEVRGALGNVAQFIAQYFPPECSGSEFAVGEWRRRRQQDQAANKERLTA